MDRATVKKIASLAKIAISEEESGYYEAALNKILALEEKMLEIDTTGIEPMSHSLDMVQRMRQDVVTEKNERELLLSIAPQTMAGLYLVPKVIE